MSGVGLDGGQDSLTGRSSGGSSSSSYGETSVRKTGVEGETSIRKTGVEGETGVDGKAGIGDHGSSDWSGGFDLGDDVSGGSGVHTGGEGKVGIRVRDDGDGGSLDLFGLTLLPLLGGGGSSSGLSGSVSLSEGSLGFSNLGGVLDSDRKGKVENWGNKGSGSCREGRDGWANWKVGGRDPESVDGVSDVVGGLKESVGINVLVRPGGHSEGVTGLSAS